MKNNLWIFGCSHSTRIPFVTGGFVKPYTEYISERLDLNLISLEESASGNDFILNKFIQNIDKFNSNDIVIIQLTHFSRKNFYCSKQKNKVFGNYHIKGFSNANDWEHPVNTNWASIIEYIFPQTIIDTFELVLKIEKLIGCKIYIFSYEDWNKYDIDFYKEYFNSKQLIKFGDEKFTSLGEYHLKYKLTTLAETGEKQDGHMSTESHKRVSELIYKYIKENE
jgi:hypothetical protein